MFCSGVTREQVSELNSGFSSFLFDDTKVCESRSPSPLTSDWAVRGGADSRKRRVVRGRRGLHFEGSPVDCVSLSSRSAVLSGVAKACKRTYDVMSAGSPRLAQVFGTAPMIRMPPMTLLYTRATAHPFRVQKAEHSSASAKTSSTTPLVGASEMSHSSVSSKPSAFDSRKDAFSVLMHGADSGHRQSADVSMDTSSTVSSEPKAASECASEPVSLEVFKDFRSADSSSWRVQTPYGKVLEYQLSNSALILDLSQCSQLSVAKDQSAIEVFAVDHGASGYLVEGRMFLFKAHSVWRLLDDDKRAKRSQRLITDMFCAQRMHQTDFCF